MWRIGLIGLTAAGCVTQPAPQASEPTRPPAQAEAAPTAGEGAPAPRGDQAPKPAPTITGQSVGPFRVGMDMKTARTLRDFRFEDGRTGEEGAIPIVTVYRGDERFATLWPSDGKLSKVIARSPSLATAEGVAPGMRASEVFAKLEGSPDVLVACEDSEGTSIKIGSYPYELIFGECGLDSVRKADSVLQGIGVP